MTVAKIMQMLYLPCIKKHINTIVGNEMIETCTCTAVYTYLLNIPYPIPDVFK